jgi:hypothetical protein
MRKLSDCIRFSPYFDIPISGNIESDLEKYIEDKNIPPANQNFNSNMYTLIYYRLSYGKNIEVHTLTNGVIQKVLNTKIEYIPNEIPKFMKKPFLIEARHNKTLYDNIYSIGGFTVNNEICLLIDTILGNEQSFYCQHERASFDGRKIDDLNLLWQQGIDYGDFLKYKTRKDTFAFLTIFSLMLEAEKTPILVETKKEKTDKNNKNKRNFNIDTEWITKRVYIDKNIKYVKENSNEHNILDKEGKQLKDVNVTGHLRQQHYGKNLEFIKTIYVETYDSKRWKKEKDTRIIVDVYDKKL